MIKIYCDKCGESITKFHKVSKTEYATNNKGHKIAKFVTNEQHLCDKCYNLRNIYQFNIYDKVITATGQIGWIVDICHCDKCKERGFYEPIVKIETGIDNFIRIDYAEKENGFPNFYRIGNHIFGHLKEEELLNEIENKQKEIDKNRLEYNNLLSQHNVLQNLKISKD